MVKFGLKIIALLQNVYAQGKIFNFCNLEWSEKILKFYKRKNLNVKTLSNKQVRSEIFKYEKTKYEPYYYLLNDFNEKYEWLK